MSQSRNRETSAASKHVSDADCLRRLASGEVGALATLYDRYSESLYRFISHATGHASDVEDVVHVAFLTAAKAAASFDGRQSCRPWLLGIAARLVYRRRRTLARFRRALRELASRQEGTQRDPQRELMARDELDVLGKALERLSDAKRMALILSEVEGMSAEEIAATLNVPVGTVWTRLHHARVELRRVMHQMGDR
jgi:RNA polymerase sigma-70 factor (ECF subfamily)